MSRFQEMNMILLKQNYYRRRSLALIDKKGAKKILDKVLSIMKNELSWNEAKYVNEKKEALELLERAL